MLTWNQLKIHDKKIYILNCRHGFYGLSARQFIIDRKANIRRLLDQYTHLPSSITKEYQAMNGDLYKYTQQVRQYKQTLNDPDKLEQTALNLLRKTAAFNDFVQHNSQLALLFGSSDAISAPGSPSGLQLRSDIQALLGRQLGAQASDPQSLVSQNLQSAQSALSTVKDRLGRWGPDAKDVDDPSFKPNDMSTKSLWQRLEYGVNVQTQHSSYYYPTTTDLGFSLGYRLSNKGTIGIGASAKIGWGSDIQHLQMTGNGLGLRSFVDVLLKKTYYISGGFEYNYQNTYTSLRQLPQFKYWQQSGLIGLSKILAAKGKVFKKTKLQLLWDFLSYRQTPPTPAVKFRVGYTF
jgi:hypothetical protein